MLSRSGRIIKKPERYEPNEKVEDDFSESDYDTEDDNGSDCSSIVTSECEDDDGEDLEGFIVPDDVEDEEYDENDDEEEDDDEEDEEDDDYFSCAEDED